MYWIISWFSSRRLEPMIANVTLEFWLTWNGELWYGLLMPVLFFSMFLVDVVRATLAGMFPWVLTLSSLNVAAITSVFSSFFVVSLFSSSNLPKLFSCLFHYLFLRYLCFYHKSLDKSNHLLLLLFPCSFIFMSFISLCFIFDFL